MSVDNPLGTIFGVWAHPDDETYLSAGRMTRAVLSGDRVVLVTATRGELGSPDEDRWPSGAPLAAVRTAEMETALARVTDLMAEVQPDTVLTFGPDGMTGHTDHQAASRWATEAFGRVGRPGAVLAYATHTPDWVERFEPALESVGAYMDDTRTPVTPVDELAYAVQLEGDLLETKLRAIRSMTSQIEPLVAALGESFFREGMVEEAFRLP